MLSLAVVVQSLSHVQVCEPLDWSLSGSSVHGIFQAEHWSGLPFPSPGDLPLPGIEPVSPALQADSFLLSHQGRPPFLYPVLNQSAPCWLSFRAWRLGGTDRWIEGRLGREKPLPLSLLSSSETFLAAAVAP